jgi:hypothetical protein
VVYLHKDPFTSWIEAHPDPEFKWHVHFWSYFCDFQAGSCENKAKYELADNETLVLHKVGSMCGPLFGRGCGHLWKWDGDELTLLEEGYDQWVS